MSLLFYLSLDCVRKRVMSFERLSFEEIFEMPHSLNGWTVFDFSATRFELIYFRVKIYYDFVNNIDYTLRNPSIMMCIKNGQVSVGNRT